ncbi:MAG: MmgE/PrpD family protein [Pirellulales bacterium]
MPPTTITLDRRENQARGLARYAIDFVTGLYPGAEQEVVEQVERFHRDSIACGASALAMRTNAPTVLRQEAFCYRSVEPRQGVPCFGSSQRVMPEKAVLANCAAVREWDANGTNFGFNPARGATRGEFGHNDFYPVVVAAAQLAGWDGIQTTQAMICLDEIRGRLAEVFSLKQHKIDHVLHGAIASAAVYAAMLGASVDEIESALGLVVAHSVPFRAIRAGHQLSDSKGASAAISAEQAVIAVQRAMRGFVGPADIFRNPEAVFCWFEKPERPDESPFDLTLATAGTDFAVMGMHFKLGLYEHQSAGAIQALIDLLQRYPQVATDPGEIDRVRIRIYQPALGIIGDPAKRDPRTRQSADHSMVYIIATLLRKAIQGHEASWEALMLLPDDYQPPSLFDPLTRELIERIEFVHGGPDYDAKYPDGIPTSLEIEHTRLGRVSSGLVMYPAGHARNPREDLDRLIKIKFSRLASLAVDDVDALWRRFSDLASKGPREIDRLYDFAIRGCADEE